MINVLVLSFPRYAMGGNYRIDTVVMAILLHLPSKDSGHRDSAVASTIVGTHSPAMGSRRVSAGWENFKLI